MYIADLVALTDKHDFCPHIYADDTHIYGSTRHSAVNDLDRRLSACIDDFYSWMQSNCLPLNTSKTELLWCATTSRQHLLPWSALRIGADAITPSTTVRDLGIFSDADLSMRSHVQRTVAGCIAAATSCIRRSVSSSVFQTLVVALVLSSWTTVMLCWLAVGQPT